MKSVATLPIAAAILSGTAEAFWRMECRGSTTLARIDPIVNPGVQSSHGHTVHGGSNFGMTTTYKDLRASECSSCIFPDDKSAYWTPSLHFVHNDGMTEIVPQIGGMLAYYELNGENLKAFPEGFQMIAGDTRLRNYSSGPIPDKPTSLWGPQDMTQFALGQKSLGFNCLDYTGKTEGSRYRHTMPDKAYMDANCKDGIRAELFFPSCWNGKDKDTKDHKSHVAYPSLIDGGECPEGFPVRLPSLFYETIWNTYAFTGKAGQFVWSNGDPTGAGYHGDFINGWNVPVLQSAVNTCTNLTGRVQDCEIFNKNLQTEDEQEKCKTKSLPKILSKDDCAGPAKGLCGNVPIQYGPGYAEELKVGNVGAPIVPQLSSVALDPFPSYAPARSVVNGISVYNVNTDVAPAAVPSPADKQKPEAPSAAIAAVITPAPAPAPAAPQDGKNIISTTTYTSAGVVYEVAIEEVMVTTTVTEGYKHRRHNHARAHLNKRREHGLAH